MSEPIALKLLELLIVAFPPLAELFARYLPEADSTEPLVTRIRELLPSESASARAVKILSFGVIDGSDDEDKP